MDDFSLLSGAAHSGAFGSNGLPQPTLAQVRSGNYRKGRVVLQGLPIAIETPQGTRRTGKSDGAPWSVICQAHYGYIEKTKGADGDELDVFVGPWPESTMVYVVNRVDKAGAFDEHKLLLGFPDKDSALTAYRNSYEAGADGLESVVDCSIDQLKWWIEFGNHAVPLTSNHLPYDGTATMNDIAWDSSANPVGISMPNLLYALRRNDSGENLMLDSVTVADVLEASDGESVLDGLVLLFNQLERKLGQMQVIMRAAGDSVKPVALQVTPPFKQRGTTNVAGIFEMSDGQTITVFFHNPDSTPNKLTPNDEMVSWKWMLNKKDVTIVVAREQGRELNPREVARRIMRLVQANSARFQAANSKRAERLAGIEASKSAIESKQKTLDELNAEIERLEPLVAAKRAAPPATLQEDDHVNRDNQNAGIASNGSPERTDAPGILEVETAMTQAGNGSAWWSDAGVNYVINKAATLGWVARPSTSQVSWTQAGIDALNAAKGKVAVVQRPDNEGPDPIVERALQLIRDAKGGVAKLRRSLYFTFDFDGEEILFGDELRAKVEAALGEKVKAVVLPGLELQTSIVPESYEPQDSTSNSDAVAGGVLAALEAAGWARSDGAAIATKTFKSLDITKDALAFLTDGDGHNRTLQFEFVSEGRNVAESSGVLIPVGATSEKAEALAAAGIASAEKQINDSYGARLAVDDPLAEARTYLGTVIDGSIDLADPAVADRLTELYEAHNGNAEFDDLFGKAADAYQAFMVSAAQAALAA